MSNFIWISSSAPTNFDFYAAYISDTIFTPPESGWYRVYCIGKCGDGGARGPWGDRGGSGGGGGGSGGMAVSNLILSAGMSTALTFTNGTASFGGRLYATAGANGQDAGVDWTGNPGGVGGQGYLGNVANFSGFVGGRGGRSAHADTSFPRTSENGLNGGGMAGPTGNSSSSEQPAGSGGAGGSRLPGDSICPYIAPDYSSNGLYQAARGGSQTGSGIWIEETPSDRYPPITLDANLVVYGGGGGGGGYGSATSPLSFGQRSYKGSPAVIIIEKAR